MSISRRQFLFNTGLLAAGAAMGSDLLAGTSKKANPFGIQLWTLRDIIGADTQGVLKQLSGFGYRFVEGFEGP
jgi:hypothetical protein